MMEAEKRMEPRDSQANAPAVPPGLQSLPFAHVLLLLNRIMMGWYFAVAGWTKTAGELSEGLGTFYRGPGFGNRTPAWLPDFIAAPYGYALPWLELILGAILIVGFFGRATAWAVTFLLVTIGIALLASGELLPRHHVMVFLPATLLLAFWGPGRYSLDACLRNPEPLSGKQ